MKEDNKHLWLPYFDLLSDDHETIYSRAIEIAPCVVRLMICYDGASCPTVLLPVKTDELTSVSTPDDLLELPIRGIGKNSLIL